ncbi:MAG: cation-translocating P-type ATPase [Bowdeniella nasicola]|nr:cation-translocating P-type ATPase [Bowdeniella nasicola]
MHTRLSRWAVVTVSAGLIVCSWLADFISANSAAFTLADALMLGAALVAGWPVVRAAISALIARDIGIDALVSVAAIGAIAIGNYWEAAAVTFLFAIGGALENATLTKTRNALQELVAIAPDIAYVLRDGSPVEVAASSVRSGETVVIQNGGKVPVDGTIIDGSGTLDQASITGESLPVDRGVGEKVYAGTILTSGFLSVKATGIGADTTLARIIHRVEQAQDAKARTQTMMERFSRWYTPAIIILALISGLLMHNLELALTLLVIGCPGALVISIPVAIVSGIGRAARDGILIKGGEFLETVANVDLVAVDKTGTLTCGAPALTDVISLDPDISSDELLAWAARAEAGSEHPLAQPIVAAGRRAGLDVSLPDAFESLPGRGVRAHIGKMVVLVGNARLVEREHVSDPHGAALHQAGRLAARGRTPMIVALQGRAIGVIGVADRIRDQAAPMVRALHAAGVNDVVMLTGDTQPIAQAVAEQTGVDTVYAELLPEDKLEHVAALRERGHTVAMVGDGVNDAPALATADIGVAMGAAGSPAAVETADIALMADDLMRLPQALNLAKRTRMVMRENIVIALATVVVLIAGVFAGGVTMALGMLVHEASVLVVIANAMRLLRAHKGEGLPLRGASERAVAPARDNQAHSMTQR